MRTVALGLSENPEEENMKREKVPRQNPGKMPTYGFRDIEVKLAKLYLLNCRNIKIHKILPLFPTTLFLHFHVANLWRWTIL